MQIHILRPLFAWEALEDSPSLKTIRAFLRLLPDGRLLEGLRHWRGRGRDDYPVSVLWGVVVLTPLLRHTSFEACLAELRRNEGLRRLLGIDSEAQVPKKWNISRFVEVLGHEPHRSEVRRIFDTLVSALGKAAPSLGQHTAGDATHLHGRPKEEAAAQAEAAQGLPQASGGRKEYTDDQGQVTRVLEWFGYKLHLLVDVQHEVALAYQITSAHDADNGQVPALLEQAQANLPPQRIATLAYDKAADDEKVHELLDQAKIKPLIQNRSLWKDEHERRPPGQRVPLNVVHDEAGTLPCYDQVSQPPVRHPMAYIGHEPQRQTLKYRCPARHEGWSCPADERCNRGQRYGLAVRVRRDLDLRRFPPIPRATKQFERLYKGRTAAERVNARMKIFWGIDDGNITGSRRFHAFVGVVMVVHAGLATLLASAPRWEGRMGRMNLGPIAQQLQAAATG